MRRTAIGWGAAVVLLIGLVAWSISGTNTLPAPAAPVAPPQAAPEAPKGSERPLPAPDISIATSKGVVRLSQFRGKVVLVDFWATWCGPCRESLPFVQRMYDRYKGQGFRVMGIAMERQETVKNLKPYMKQIGMTYPAGQPRSEAELAPYNAGSIPFMVLVDRQGLVRWYQKGYDMLHRRDALIEQKIKELL